MSEPHCDWCAGPTGGYDYDVAVSFRGRPDGKFKLCGKCFHNSTIQETFVRMAVRAVGSKGSPPVKKSRQYRKRRQGEAA